MSFFKTDGGFTAMSRKHGNIIRKNQDFFFYVFYKQSMIPTR